MISRVPAARSRSNTPHVTTSAPLSVHAPASNLSNYVSKVSSPHRSHNAYQKDGSFPLNPRAPVFIPHGRSKDPATNLCSQQSGLSAPAESTMTNRFCGICARKLDDVFTTTRTDMRYVCKHCNNFEVCALCSKVFTCVVFSNVFLWPKRSMLCFISFASWNCLLLFKAFWKPRSLCHKL